MRRSLTVMVPRRRRIRVSDVTILGAKERFYFMKVCVFVVIPLWVRLGFRDTV